MNAVWAIIVAVFVIGTIAFIAVGLFWLTPWAHRENEFRERDGKRHGESPHLETRDEYERAHPA
jgi:hypothetical protein